VSGRVRFEVMAFKIGHPAGGLRYPHYPCDD
jgi:hypothetical protein